MRLCWELRYPLSVWALLKMMFLFPFGGICRYASSLKGNWFVFRGVYNTSAIYDQAYSVNEYDHHGNKSRKEFDGILHGKVWSLVVVKGIAPGTP